MCSLEVRHCCLLEQGEEDRVVAGGSPAHDWPVNTAHPAAVDHASVCMCAYVCVCVCECVSL